MILYVTRSNRLLQSSHCLYYSMSTSAKTLIEPDATRLLDRVVSLRDWWHQQNRVAKNETQRIPIMDLRSREIFQKTHMSHSKLLVVPFPFQHLRDRSFELPARHVDFSILVPKSEIDSIEDFLLGSKPNARKRSRKPWKVTHVLIDDPDLWKEAERLGILVSEPNTSTQDYSQSFKPLPRLWQPDPMVCDTLLPLLVKSKNSSVRQEVWDLASGAGRDVAFLAEELVAADANYDVIGFDHRYNEKESGITSGFWDRRGVGDRTKCVKLDLSRWEHLSEQLRSQKPAALFAVRFWKEELVSSIAKCDKLLPGTIFGLSHFCKPYEGASWDFDHPSEKTVLERNQLKTMFSDAWDIVSDEIQLDSDHGRTMIQFVARKRS